MNQAKKRVLVIGGGFMGLLAARRAARDPAVQVTILDRSPSFVFLPRLIDALGNPAFPKERYIASLETIAKRDGYTFIHGEALSINRADKFVTYQSHGRQEPDTFAYDALLYATGSRTKFFNTPGAMEFSCPLKSLDDLARVHARITQALERAAASTDVAEQRRALSFVVVGAGPSGVESVFALRSFVRAWCAEHTSTIGTLASYALVQAGPQILPGFPAKLVQGAMSVLAQERIMVYVGEAVTRVEQDQITTSLRRIVPASIVLWTAGVEPVLIKCEPEMHADGAGIIVDHALHVDQSHLAGGDASSYREQNVLIPKNAQTAMHMARVAAKNLSNCTGEHMPALYHYRALGNIITVGTTGFFDIRGFILKSSLVPFLRDFIYRVRMRQMVG